MLRKKKKIIFRDIKHSKLINDNLQTSIVQISKGWFLLRSVEDRKIAKMD